MSLFTEWHPYCQKSRKQRDVIEPSTNELMKCALAKPLSGDKQIVPPRRRVEPELSAAEKSQLRREIEEAALESYDRQNANPPGRK